MSTLNAVCLSVFIYGVLLVSLLPPPTGYCSKLPRFAQMLYLSQLWGGVASIIGSLLVFVIFW